MTVQQDTVAAITARIAQLDTLISTQLNAIMHDEAFQTLEAAWRGLHDLVMQTKTSTRLKLRLLPAAEGAAHRPGESHRVRSSTLFKKLYEEEYGTYGGNPYGLLLGDYAFSRHPQDMALLEKLSTWRRRHAPFVPRRMPPVRSRQLYRTRRAARPGQNFRER